jgi:hypothetical protein
MKKVLLVSFIVLALATMNSKATLVANYNFDQTNGGSYLLDSTSPATDIPVTSTAASLFVTSGAGVSGCTYDFGTAGDFANTGGYYQSTSTGHTELNFGTGDFTISGWFKAADTTDTTDNGFIIQNATSSSAGYWLYLGRPDRTYSNKLRFSVRGGTGITVESDNTVTDNEWHWYAVVVNNQTVTMYVDGVLQVSAASYITGTSATSTTNFRIGRYYDGYADEMNFYDTALNTGADYAEDGKTLVSGDLYDLWQIPEPATIVLLGLGMLSFIRRK